MNENLFVTKSTEEVIELKIDRLLYVIRVRKKNNRRKYVRIVHLNHYIQSNTTIVELQENKREGTKGKFAVETVCLISAIKTVRNLFFLSSLVATCSTVGWFYGIVEYTIKLSFNWLWIIDRNIESNRYKFPNKKRCLHCSYLFPLPSSVFHLPPFKLLFK